MTTEVISTLPKTEELPPLYAYCKAKQNERISSWVKQVNETTDMGNFVKINGRDIMVEEFTGGRQKFIELLSKEKQNQYFQFEKSYRKQNKNIRFGTERVYKRYKDNASSKQDLKFSEITIKDVNEFLKEHEGYVFDKNREHSIEIELLRVEEERKTQILRNEANRKAEIERQRVATLAPVYLSSYIEESQRKQWVSQATSKLINAIKSVRTEGRRVEEIRRLISQDDAFLKRYGSKSPIIRIFLFDDVVKELTTDVKAIIEIFKPEISFPAISTHENMVASNIFKPERIVLTEKQRRFIEKTEKKWIEQVQKRELAANLAKERAFERKKANAVKRLSNRWLTKKDRNLLITKVNNATSYEAIDKIKVETPEDTKNKLRKIILETYFSKDSDNLAEISQYFDRLIKETEAMTYEGILLSVDRDVCKLTDDMISAKTGFTLSCFKLLLANKEAIKQGKPPIYNYLTDIKEYRVVDICTLFKVSSETVRNWISKGWLPVSNEVNFRRWGMRLTTTKHTGKDIRALKRILRDEEIKKDINKIEEDINVFPIDQQVKVERIPDFLWSDLLSHAWKLESQSLEKENALHLLEKDNEDLPSINISINKFLKPWKATCDGWCFHGTVEIAGEVTPWRTISGVCAEDFIKENTLEWILAKQHVEDISQKLNAGIGNMLNEWKQMVASWKFVLTEEMLASLKEDAKDISLGIQELTSLKSNLSFPLRTFESTLLESLKKDENVSQDIKDGILDLNPLLKDYEVNFPTARSIGRRWTAYLGPTNSGKTYQALELLKKAKTGAYLAPLRLMAVEIYDKLNAEGIPCNLITGEEKIIHPEARHVSSTIEMMNYNHVVDVAVIDEVQMAEDDERGWAWTQAMVGMPARQVIAVGSDYMSAPLKRLTQKLREEYDEHILQRKSPLKVINGTLDLTEVKEGDAIIAFSRMGILAYRGWLRGKGISSACIYGNLGPEVRRQQSEMFASGQAKVLVATDAIGMGLNLPIKRVVFSTTTKYDGRSDRTLTAQEIKQIGGRAGRYGIHEAGEIAVLTEAQNGSNFLKRALEKELSFKKSKFSVKPTWELVAFVASSIPNPNIVKVLSYLKSHWLIGSNEWEPSNENNHDWVNYLSTCGLSLREQFDYLGCPIDNRNWSWIKSWITKHKNGQRVHSTEIDDFKKCISQEEHGKLEKLEFIAKQMTIYRWLNIKFGLGIFCDVDKVSEDYIKVSHLIMDMLTDAALKRLCNSCGKSMPPSHKFPECQSCYEARRSRRWNRYNDYDDDDFDYDPEDEQTFWKRR